MVLNGTPQQQAREGYGDFSTETTKASAAAPTTKGNRSRRKRPLAEALKRGTPHLSVVGRDGSLHSREAEALPAEAVTVTKPVGVPVRILLVDADANDRSACCAALQRQVMFEADVLEAETGQGGLRIALQQPLDCILIGNTLPDMSFKDFIAQLSHGDARLPVLNLADGADFASLDQEAKSVVHDCLIKDADGHYLELLPAAIKRMLDGHRNLKGKRQAEAMYRTLIEHIQAITYIASPHHGNQITYVSPQIEQLGITPDVWMTNPGQRFQHVHADDREAAEQAFSHTCRSGEAFCQEYRVCRASGEVRWFHDTASVVKDRSGQPMFVQGVMVDITGTKAMEAELDGHRYYMERRVAERTETLSRRVAILESCNAALCDQMEKLRAATARRILSMTMGQPSRLGIGTRGERPLSISAMAVAACSPISLAGGDVLG